ncbi:hypothetical protein D3C71_1719570 [compost metagenome]
MYPSLVPMLEPVIAKDTLKAKLLSSSASVPPENPNGLVTPITSSGNPSPSLIISFGPIFISSPLYMDNAATST